MSKRPLFLPCLTMTPVATVTAIFVKFSAYICVTDFKFGTHLKVAN